MPKSKIEQRLTRQLAGQHVKNAAGMAHALLVKADIITPKGDLTAKGKKRNEMTPGQRAKDRAVKASGGKHKASDYVYSPATNSVKLKAGAK